MFGPVHSPEVKSHLSEVELSKYETRKLSFFTFVVLNTIYSVIKMDLLSKAILLSKLYIIASLTVL